MAISGELRGLVYSRFENLTQMAESIGWSRQRLYKALKNPRKQNLENYHKIIQALGLADTPDTLDIFLRS